MLVGVSIFIKCDYKFVRIFLRFFLLLLTELSIQGTMNSEFRCVFCAFCIVVHCTPLFVYQSTLSLHAFLFFILLCLLTEIILQKNTKLISFWLHTIVFSTKFSSDSHTAWLLSLLASFNENHFSFSASCPEALTIPLKCSTHISLYLYGMHFNFQMLRDKSFHFFFFNFPFHNSMSLCICVLMCAAKFVKRVSKVFN